MPLVFAPTHEPTRNGFSQRNVANVRRAKFEGGYSQRSRKGPNSIDLTVPLIWEVPEVHKVYIDDFFRARAGSEAFQYQLPWDTVAKLWTCVEWDCSDIGVAFGGPMWRISTSLVQEFDIV